MCVIEESCTVTPVDVILRRNPSHYSGSAQLIGARGVAYVQEEFGAKVRLLRFMLGFSCWTTRVRFCRALDQALEQIGRRRHPVKPKPSGHSAVIHAIAIHKCKTIARVTPFLFPSIFSPALLQRPGADAHHIASRAVDEVRSYQHGSPPEGSHGLDLALRRRQVLWSLVITKKHCATSGVGEEDTTRCTC